MHRTTPLTSAFVGYTGGGVRALVDTANDETGMQEMKGSFMKGEAREKIESPQNYGFTSVVLPAKKGKDGQIEECAEAYMGFLGSNRSFPVAMVMDDRRHRPWGLKPGENAQYDDIGQMTLMRRNGLFLLSLDSEDTSQQSGSGGATPTQQAEGGGQSKKVERMVSMRHVEKKKQERPKGKSQSGQSGGSSGGGIGSASPTQQDTSGGGQSQSNGKDHKHEGETVNTEIRCTKNRIEFRAGDTVVGYYDKGADTWFLKGKIVNIEGTEKVSVKATQRVETIGKTYLGLENKDEDGPKVMTEEGPTERVRAKMG